MPIPQRGDAEIEATDIQTPENPSDFESGPIKSGNYKFGLKGRWHIWLTNMIARLRKRGGSEPERRSQDNQSTEIIEGDETDTVNPPLSNVRDFNPIPRDSKDDLLSSDQIFAEIGSVLLARRELLGLTHEEIQRHTRLRTAFLRGLELGDLESLPSPVQTRGILANYAAFLDLDADTLLLRFADGLQARHREQKPRWQSPRTKAPMTVHTSLPPLRSFIASDLLFGGGVAIVLLLFAVWGINRVISIRSANPARATSPSISEVLAGTAVATVLQQVTLIPAPNTPLSLNPEPTGSFEPEVLDPNITVLIKLTANEETYLRVSEDGIAKFEGRTERGREYTYQGARQVEVVVGNAAAIKVTFNGRDLGLMGSFGEIVDRLYTQQGVLTPTATLPPTRTPTPDFTSTPSPTPTLTPSMTPTKEPGG